MKILKYMLMVLIIVFLDIYLFTGPLLNGFALIILIIINIISIIKKKKIKNQLMLLLVLIFTEIFIINIGDYYNSKIMKETEKIYNESLKNKDNRVETYVYGKYVSIPKERDYAFVRLYNFQTFIFKNNKWINIDDLKD